MFHSLKTKDKDRISKKKLFYIKMRIGSCQILRASGFTV